MTTLTNISKSREFKLVASKTYASADNARAAVAKKHFDDVRHFLVCDPDTHRWFPVFVGDAAVQRGVHFHFNVVG